jgi:hypothetical protein
MTNCRQPGGSWMNREVRQTIFRYHSTGKDKSGPD